VGRGTVTSGAAIALAGLALSATPATAGPVRMCDGNRGVIAKGIGCAGAFWLADQVRAGERIAGWKARGNSAGVVRLRHGRAWVKLRRVPRASVAALLIAGLRVTHDPPAAPNGAKDYERIELCAAGRMEGYESSGSGTVGTPPGPMSGISAATYMRGSWKPTYLVEWRGGLTLELDLRVSGGFVMSGMALTDSQHVRLELRDDGSGRLATATGAWPVSWTRDARCRA